MMRELQTVGTSQLEINPDDWVYQYKLSQVNTFETIIDNINK